MSKWKCLNLQKKAHTTPLYCTVDLDQDVRKYSNHQLTIATTKQKAKECTQPTAKKSWSDGREVDQPSGGMEE